MIRNKPRTLRRIVEFFFFFSVISAEHTMRNFLLLRVKLSSDTFRWYVFDHTRIKNISTQTFWHIKSGAFRFVTTVDVSNRADHTHSPTAPGQLALRCALCQRQRCSVGSSPQRCGMLPGSAC